jgi:hypothetical protein
MTASGICQRCVSYKEKEMRAETMISKALLNPRSLNLSVAQIVVHSKQYNPKRTKLYGFLEYRDLRIILVYLPELLVHKGTFYSSVLSQACGLHHHVRVYPKVILIL